MKLISARAAGVLADSINDADSTRKVYLLAAGLAALGVALIAITVWFWRSTRNDPELLGPLEVLGDRKFRRLDVDEQRKILEASRPEEAKPMEWGVQRGDAPSEPVVTASARANDDVVLADPERVGAVASAAVADAAAHSDLDSILAAVGAVVPGRSEADDALADDDDESAGASVASNGADPSDGDAEPADADVVVAAGAGDPVVADGDAAVRNGAKIASPDAGNEQSSTETKAASGPMSTSAGNQAEPAVVPLLIVPVDHDLRPSGGAATEPSREKRPTIVIGEPIEPFAASSHDEVVAFEAREEFDRHDPDAYIDDDDDDDVDATTSIDPLLRSFNRNDS